MTPLLAASPPHPQPAAQGRRTGARGLDAVHIAVPVRNEAGRLPRLLRALATSAARSPVPVSVHVLANDCTDASAPLARNFRDDALAVQVQEVAFPGSRPSAGRARRLAMDSAAHPGTLLLTTDGDATPGPDWIVTALAAAAAGADVVCGTIEVRAGHVLATRSGARITQAEAAYAALVHEVRHGLDQLAGRQPAAGPRPHYMESGASLAIRADAYHAIGGLPALDSSEDRALVGLAERSGLVVRYEPRMRAGVSARLRGRAPGGMAACLSRRMTDPDPVADQAMLPLATLRRLWTQAIAGTHVPYPDRARPWGLPLTASGLEAALPSLRAFVTETVRPDLARWRQATREVRAS